MTASKRKPATEQKTLTFTIPEAATELRVTEPTVYAYIADGDLEAIDIARSGSKTTRLRIPLASILAFIADRPRVHDVAAP